MTVVAISTYWGTRHGGVNALNYALVSSLVAAYPNTQFIVAALDASPFLIEKSTLSSTNLKFVIASSQQPASGAIFESYSREQIDALKASIKQHAGASEHFLIIGHDLYTGPVAREIAEFLKQEGATTRTAIFRHVSFLDYQTYVSSKSTPDVASKNREQLNLLKHFDFVFAVGPRLYESAKSVVATDKLFQFIPGMEDACYQPPHDAVRLAAFGRFDSDHDFIKQSSLVAHSFTQLTQKNANSPRPNRRWRDAALILIGTERSKTNDVQAAIREEAEFPINLQVYPYTDTPDEVEEIIKSTQANIGLVPSFYESYGLAASEFIGFGIPLILSDRTGIYDWLREAYGGSAIGCLHTLRTTGPLASGEPNRNDVATLVNAIEQVGDDLESRIKDATRLRALLKHHTWEQAAMQLGSAVGLARIPQSDRIELSANTLSVFLSEFSQKINARTQATRENELVDLLRAHLEKGRYQSARAAVDELRGLGSRLLEKKDVKCLLADLEVRSGYYIAAIQIISENSALQGLESIDVEFENEDFILESIRNVALRDYGRYDDALQHSALLVGWARRCVNLANTVESKRLAEMRLSSAMRKRIRCLSFFRMIEDAESVFDELNTIALAYQKQIDIAKAKFAMGEVYRHSNDFESAIETYQDGMRIAQDEGDLDIYTWSAICLSDAYFMAGRISEAEDALKLGEHAIKLFDEKMPIEEGYLQVSREALRWKRGTPIVNGIAALIARHSERGASWVQQYFDSLDRTGMPPFPKRF